MAAINRPLSDITKHDETTMVVPTPKRVQKQVHTFGTNKPVRSVLVKLKPRAIKINK